MDDLKEVNTIDKQVTDGLMSQYMRDLHDDEPEEEKENIKKWMNRYESREDYQNIKKSVRREENANAESRKTGYTSDKLSGSRDSQLRQSYMCGSRVALNTDKAPGIYFFKKKIDLRQPI